MSSGAWIAIGIPSVATIVLFLDWLLNRQTSKPVDRKEQWYYQSQEATFSYEFEIKHARFPRLIKIIYLIWPFSLTWRTADALKWGSISIARRNEFGQDLGFVPNVQICRKRETVRVIWPRAAVIEKDTKIISIEANQHISQEEIKKRVTIKDEIISSDSSYCRWRYELTNRSDATIRDFELKLTDKVKTLNNLKIIDTKPPAATSEIDILVKAELSLDIIKRGKRLKKQEVVWSLPKLEKKDELVLVIDC